MKNYKTIYYYYSLPNKYNKINTHNKHMKREEKVYCNNCQHYIYSDKYRDDSCKIATDIPNLKDTHLSHSQYLNPDEDNKDNDCAYFKETK